MIDYGETLRVGIIVPSGNVIAEPQLRAMFPPGVAFYVTRLTLRGSSEAELMAMMDGVEAAARLLADAKMDLIAFHCTAVTTFSPEAGPVIRARIEAATGIKGIVTSDAIAAAFEFLRLRRIVLLSPYIAAVHQREIDFVRHLGVELVHDAALGIDTNDEMGRLPAKDLADWAAKHRDDRADGYFISCTAIRTAELIAPLEAQLDRPVVTSNQMLVWYVLHQTGCQIRRPGFGKLMA